MIRSNISYLMPELVDTYVQDLFDTYLCKESHPEIMKEYIFNTMPADFIKPHIL